MGTTSFRTANAALIVALALAAGGCTSEPVPAKDSSSEWDSAVVEDGLRAEDGPSASDGPLDAADIGLDQQVDQSDLATPDQAREQEADQRPGDTTLDSTRDSSVTPPDIAPVVQCVTQGTVVCMNPRYDTPWPGGTVGDPNHPHGNFVVPPGYTHVWAFPYLGGHNGVGTIGQINGTAKRMSISLHPAAFKAVDDECSHMTSADGAVAFEPFPGIKTWRCDLQDGHTYYFNMRNESADDSEYKLVIF